MGFELPLIEEQWTKPELFINLDCNSKVYSKSNQIMASFILLKKSTSSELFLKNFLNYACNELNITDIRDNSIQPSNCFLDHRHDQSIFSLLYKKNNLRVFKDPTQFGNLNYLWKYSGLREKFIPVVGTILLENGRYLSVKKYPQSYGTILYHSRSTDRKTLLKLLVKYLIKNSHKQLTSYRKTLTI